MQNVLLYATDTMADWEYGYLTAGLAMAEEMAPGRYRLLVTAASGVELVTTKGGLRVLPDTTLGEVDAGDVALLILPGADTWAGGHEEALDLAGRLLAVGVPVAAICGATLGLARVGLLDAVPHTSNAPEFLAGAEGYAGADHYRAERTVVGGDVITAPATAPVDFARAVFERLELFPQPVIDAWYGLYTTGEKVYFDRLTGVEA